MPTCNRRLRALVCVSLLVLESCAVDGGSSNHGIQQPLMLRLRGGGDGRLGKPRRSKSTLWFEGYKVGSMQFLQSYVPDDRDGQPMVVGLAGGTGSGKTTIKKVILEQLAQEGALGEAQGDNVAVLSHDNYYKHRPELSDEERDKINFDHPDSLDTTLMLHHLEELLEGRAVECPIYDFATHLRRQNETIRVEPRPVILVEGILLFCDPALRERMNLKVFVDVEADRRILRRIERDLVQRGRNFTSIVTQYLETVKPMHDQFVEPSKQFADVIIPFGGRNIAAIQILLETLKTHLRNNFAYTNAQKYSREGAHYVDSDGEVILMDEHAAASEECGKCGAGGATPPPPAHRIYQSPRFEADDIQFPFEKSDKNNKNNNEGHKGADADRGEHSGSSPANALQQNEEGAPAALKKLSL
jgi:uridine kinase